MSAKFQHQQAAASLQKNDRVVRQTMRLIVERAHREGYSAVVADLSEETLRESLAQDLCRRQLAAPAMKEARLSDAVLILERLIAANPASVKDRLMLAKVFARAGEREKASIQFEKAGELEPDDPTIAAQCILRRLQDGRIEDAAALARRHSETCQGHPRLAQLALLALSRANDQSSAAKIIDALIDAPDLPEEVVIALAYALISAGRWRNALVYCQSNIAKGVQAARLYLYAGQAILALGGAEAEAFSYLEQAHARDAKNIGVAKAFGEILLKTGDDQKATEILTDAAARAPQSQNIRLLTARALKSVRRYDEAANLLREAVHIDPHSNMCRRYAVSALLQAKRKDEAQEIYDGLLAQKSACLNGSFADLLMALDTERPEAQIAPERLDFAWSVLRQDMGERLDDRVEWERRARWGRLADLLILDWLECRPERIGEIVDFLDEVDKETVDLFRAAHETGKGALLVGAHLGPLYAGPLAVHLTGTPYKWLASTPRISSAPHADALISTSDQTEEEVGRSVMAALRTGQWVIMAIDGAMKLSAKRVAWRGQRVTYSDFAAHLSYRRGTPCFFTIPYWRNGRIRMAARRLPEPFPGESAEAFELRWRSAYFSEIETQMKRGPENLRLSGGVWRWLR